jgi:hypothetical protein
MPKYILHGKRIVLDKNVRYIRFIYYYYYYSFSFSCSCKLNLIEHISQVCADDINVIGEKIKITGTQKRILVRWYTNIHIENMLISLYVLRNVIRIHGSSL